MRELLNDENIKKLELKRDILKIVNQFKQNYAVESSTSENTWGVIKFNYFVKILINENLNIELCGLHFKKHPQAIIKEIGVNTSIGIVTVNNLKDAVNLLAEYENILPN